MGAGTPRAGRGQQHGRRRSGWPVDRGGRHTLRAQVPCPCMVRPWPWAWQQAGWSGEAVPKLHPVAKRVLPGLDVSWARSVSRTRLIAPEGSYRIWCSRRPVPSAPKLLKLKTTKGVPGGPVVRTPAFTAEKTGFIPGLGAKLPQALQQLHVHPSKENKPTETAVRSGFNQHLLVKCTWLGQSWEVGGCRWTSVEKVWQGQKDGLPSRGTVLG